MEILHLTGPAPLYTNTFLVLDGAGTAVAVDPAADAQAYLAQLEKHGAKLAAILLTHGHFDHVGAVRALKQATGAPVHLARPDAGARRVLPRAPQDVDVFVQDGMALSFGGLSLRVLATPGHTQGSVCYLCGGTLFSGDTLFDGDVGRTDLAESVPAQMAPSLAKLGREVPPEAQVLPGHESFTTMAAQLANNRWLAAACSCFSAALPAPTRPNSLRACSSPAPSWRKGAVRPASPVCACAKRAPGCCAACARPGNAL